MIPYSLSFFGKLSSQLVNPPEGGSESERTSITGGSAGRGDVPWFGRYLGDGSSNIVYFQIRGPKR